MSDRPKKAQGDKPERRKLRVPAYLRQVRHELNVLYEIFREGLVAQVYALLVMHSDFHDGYFIGSYKGLMDYCTPPRPERGRSMPGPTMKQVRRAVAVLEGAGLVVRGEGNEARKKLVLWVPPRLSSGTPSPKGGS